MALNAPKLASRSLYCYTLVMTPDPETPGFTPLDMFRRFEVFNKDHIKQIDETTGVCLTLDGLGPAAVKGHFDWLRWEVPRVVDITQGKERFLKLAREENVLERAHFIFYPSTTVMVIEYNHYGARGFGRFGSYIKELVSEVQQCDLRPILRTDAFDRVKRQQGTFRRCEVTITSPALTILEDVFKMGTTEVMGDSPDDVTVNITISAGRKTLPKETQGLLGNLVKRLHTNKAELSALKKVELTGDEVIDLVGEDLYAKVSVLTVEENTRIVQSSSMYTAINEFYQNDIVDYLPVLRKGS